MRHLLRVKHERGFTLIEVVVAMFVFTFGALGLLRLLVSGSQGVATAGRMTQATVLAQSKLNELLGKQFTNADLTAGNHIEPGGKNIGYGGTAYTPTGAATGDYGSADGWFARSWFVADQDVDTTAAGIEFKLITVTVSWTDLSFKNTVRTVRVVGGKSL
ncbi:MAG: prepilin-type N-terminal cleavage/methylation domain-containing protein [Deltaproteobacteria bacterium]|nr:prepilin-type N-terminal cleavage/methylation domain-containing protein [Deltaproteobacteria bacterium]